MLREFIFYFFFESYANEFFVVVASFIQDNFFQSLVVFSTIRLQFENNQNKRKNKIK
jgi:hypothetical protein